MLRKLEVNKLIREFEYIKSDYDLKQELIKEADIEFLRSVDTFLLDNKELSSIYYDRVGDNSRTQDESEETCIEISEGSRDYIENEFEEKKIELDTKSDRIKKLYRKIVMICHPDKNDQKELNLIYIKATKYYEDVNIIGIYNICDSLFIDYEVCEEDINSIKVEIEKMKDRIQFIENTLTWKWYNDISSNRNVMIFEYIKSQLF